MFETLSKQEIAAPCYIATMVQDNVPFSDATSLSHLRVGRESPPVGNPVLEEVQQPFTADGI